jgi:hypothetical protein
VSLILIIKANCGTAEEHNKKERGRSVGDACYEKGSSRIVTSSKMEIYHHRDREERKNSLRTWEEDGGGRRRNSDIVAEIKCSYTVRLTRAISSFLTPPCPFPQSVSPISFGFMLQDIITCDEYLFQFCFRTRAINLLWTS